MKKINKADRARQFLPFNSLKGYYDLVKKAEIIKSNRKVLDEDEAIIISNKLNSLKRGMLVKINHYEEYGYIITEGMISNIDLVYRKITIVSKVINFDDIINIEIDEYTK